MGNIKQNLIAFSLITCVASLGYFALTKKTAPLPEVEVAYDYALKVQGQTIKSYRSPAARAREKIIEVKNKAQSDSAPAFSKSLDKFLEDPEVTDKTQSESTNYAGSYVGISESARPRYNSSPGATGTLPKSTGTKTTGTSTGMPGMSFSNVGFPTPAANNNQNTNTSTTTESNSTTKTVSPYLKGKVKPLVGVVTYQSPFGLMSSAYANTCTNPRILLLDLTDMSILHDTSIKELVIDENTNFDFNPVELKLDLKTPNRYMLETKGCEINYQRIISSFYKDQDLDQSTTLISKVINTRIAGVLPTTSAESMQKLYDLVQERALATDNFERVYDIISQEAALKANFQSTFQGGAVDELTDAAPDINEVTLHAQLKEKDSYNFTVSAFHWNSQYTIGYEWQVDGELEATTNLWTYIPNANSKPIQKVTLIIGSKNSGDDQVDRTRPYHEVDFDVSISDEFPSLAPTISLNAASTHPSATRSIVLNMNTGSLIDDIYSACESSSSLALTEDNQLPTDSDFTITCENGPVQILNYNIQSATDAVVTLKLWSKDAADRVSGIPSTMVVELDTTAPLIEFLDIQSGFISDEDSEFKWSLKERNTSSAQFFNLQFFNGTSWSNLPAISLTNGPHDGTEFSTTFHLPNINTNAAKLKITYTDTLGHQTVIESSAFEIQRPILGSNPLNLDMGQVLNKTLSNEFTLNFTNSGAVSTKVCGPVVLSGANAGDFQITSDECNGERIGATGCPVGIKVTPAQKGTRTAIATVTCHNDTYSTPITVQSINNPPVVIATQTKTTMEDTAVTVSFGPISDADNDILTYSVMSSPAHGALSSCQTVAAEYVCTYTPTTNYIGNDSFTFKSNDGTIDSNIGTINLTVLAINDAPTLPGPQSISTNEDVALTFDLLAGSDIENDPLTYLIETTPSNGSLSCVGGTSTSCTYTPALNFNGTDSFTYKVRDGTLTSATMTVTVTVNPLNDPPVPGSNQTLAATEDTVLTFTINSGSDIDLPAQTLSYKIVSAPTKGTLSGCITTGSYATDLSCTYTPNLNANGADVFTYKVFDSVTDSVTNGTITINIAAVNDAPTLTATQSLSTPEDTAISFNLNAGSDIELSPLTYNIVSAPANGTLSCTGGTSTNCTFTPALNFEGTTTFTYRVNDGSLNSTLATVTITVAGENDPPVIGANQSVTTNEDTAVAFTINTATDIDVPAQTLSYKIITNPTKGTLSGCITDAAYGTVRNCTYTPNLNATGSDTFTYRANDGLVDSTGLATVTITITPVNDAPALAATQSASTSEDTPLTFNLNAGTDIESNPLTYVKDTNTANGTITCVGGASRSCTYTPNANFNGTDTFTYHVNDGSANSTTATVTITVNPVNDPPVVAANQTLTATEDTLLAFTITAGTDIDLPAQTLSYILISAPTKGVLTNCIATGSYSTDRICDYQPNLNATGADTLTYRVYDSLLESVGTATITINITAVNDAPTLVATQSVSTAEDTPLTFNLNAGADTEASALTYIKVTNTTNGTITCVGGTSRSCTYTPNANYNGSDSFTYKVNDGTADSTVATVTITVTPVNDPPVMAANQTYSVNDNTNLAITLSPATDIDGGALTYKIVTLPANGTLSACISTGAYGTDLTCNYISNANFNGADTFTFVAYDTFTNATTAATVTINVSDKTVAPAPLLTLTSPVYTKVTGVTFTASSCTDTPMLFVNESTAPTSGAAGWQACSTTANAITYTMGTAQGAHTVKVWAKDTYGNVSATSTDFTIYYDTVLPTMSLTLPPTLKGGATYSLAWTATESYTTTSLNFTVESYNGTAWSTVGTTASTAGPLSATAFTRTWTVPVVNTAGAMFRVSFTDRAGNSATVTSAVFTIDSTIPGLTIATPAANSYHKTSAIITGACETGRSISFTGSIQADFSISCVGGTYSQTVNFSDGDGNKTITVSQTDAVGNVATVSRNLIRDEVPPVMAKTTGNSPDFTKLNVPNTWGGTCEGNYTISVTGSQTTTFACTAGTWSWTPASKTVDGTYSYNLVQTDGAGNVSAPPLTLAWTRDATAPLFNMSNPTAASAGQTKSFANNLSALTFTGSCEGTNAIVISGAVSDTISCSSSSWTWTTPTVSADGLRSFTFTQTDSAGNAAAIIINWTRDTTGPALKIASALLKSNTNTITFTGTCETGYTIDVTGTQTGSATCTAGNWSFTTASNATDATRAYTFKQTFTVTPFNSTSVVGTWIRETDLPTISSFTTTATNPSRSSYIPVSLSSTSQNTQVFISHVCVKSDVAIQPAVTDPCFVAVNGPVIGQALAQTLILSNYSILMGWTPKTYDIFVWVKDEAGNISNLTNTGAGTLLTDKLNHSYDPGIPPTVIDVAAANIANSPIPPTRAQSEVPAGTDVFIRWKATDNIALPAGAVSLSYTPDEINFTQFVSNLNNANYGCTGITLGANEGCYKWVGGSPLNTSYKIRVKVTDAGDVSNQLISNPVNSGLIKIIAGNSESGLGGSAQTAMFFSRRLGDLHDPGTIAVTDDGQFYFADYKRGILTIDQADGKQKIFIAATGTSSGDGGPAVNATLKYAVKIALDYQNRLLIMDRDRIRRVDLNLSTPTIETIIGGGAVTTDIVANPRDLSIYSHGTNGDWSYSPVFFTTPNGDIYFSSELPYKPNTTPTYRIRIYKAGTGQIISKYFSGNGDFYVPTQDLTKCRLMHPGIAFDPSSSQLTGVTLISQHDLSYSGCDQMDDRYSRTYYDPVTFETIAPKDEIYRYYTYMHYTGMDGKVYMNGARTFISRVNFDGTYTRILGSGVRGECADGTLATACAVDVQNFFVSTAGKMYFTDRGVIRTIDENGNVKSLFGQRLTFGHGLNALNARFSDVSNVFRLDNGKIIASDPGGYFIKEFTIEGNINIIAGNGSSGAASTTVDPLLSSISDASWLAVNKANGDVFAHQSNSGHGLYTRLNRITNRWENFLGSTGGVNYTTADGELGLNVLGTNSSNATSRGLIMGFANNQLILARMRLNSTLNRYEDQMIKSYDALDGYRQSHIAGVLGFPADDNTRRTCDATVATTAANCEMPYWDTFYQWQYDAENARWITAIVNGGTQKDIYEITDAGMIKKIGTTTNNIDDAFVYVKLDGVENFYYCNSGRLRRYNLTTKVDMGALTWSMTNLNCKGKTMDFNPTNRSIVFPFEQNGLGGVAEYFIP